MATQRYISTSFWTDKWIRQLDPSERYLYLYFLTNPQTNIAGIYQITLDRIAFDTGYDERTLRPMIERFQKARKAFYIDDEWIVIPAWPKHQKITKSKNGEKENNTKKGIDRILRDLPDGIWEAVIECGYQYEYLEDVGRGLQGASRGFKGLTRSSNYSDSDSDSDSDLDLDLDTDLKGAPTAAAEPLQPDTVLYNRIKDIFEKEQPQGKFSNYGKEGKAIHGLIEKAKARSPDNPGDFLDAMTQVFRLLRETDKFYRGQPFLPSSLNASGIWDRVLNEAMARWKEEREAAAFDPVESGVVF